MELARHLPRGGHHDRCLAWRLAGSGVRQVEVTVRVGREQRCARVCGCRAASGTRAGAARGTRAIEGVETACRAAGGMPGGRGLVVPARQRRGDGRIGAPDGSDGASRAGTAVRSCPQRPCCWWDAGGRGSWYPHDRGRGDGLPCCWWDAWRARLVVPARQRRGAGRIGVRQVEMTVPVGQEWRGSCPRRPCCWWDASRLSAVRW